MEEQEKNNQSDLTKAEKQKYQDEPFTYVEKENGKSFPAIFWAQWALLFLVAFYFISIFVDGFGNMHKYGIQESTGINYIFLISKTEKIFYIALLMLLPATFFLTLFLEKIVKPEIVSKLSKLTEPKNALKTTFALMVIVGIIILVISLGILKQSPIADDENVYLFQTRIMASGHLTLEGKPGRDSLFEDNIFLVNNNNESEVPKLKTGQLYGQYPFGHSALLLIGYFFNFAYLTQILAAMTIILGAFLLGKELYGTRTGLITALLICVSPSFLFTSSTLLSHTNTLLFLTWFGYFAVKTVREDKWFYPILCGLCFGAAFNIRGASTLLIALPAALTLAAILLIQFFIAVFTKSKKGITNTLKKILLLGVTVLGSVGFFLFINWYINGDPFYSNYHAAWLGKTKFDSPFGFGKGAWRIIHTPTQGLLNMVNNFFKLNAWVFGWPIGFIFVLIWAIRKGRKAVDFLLLLPIFITFAAYVFYFWPGISDTGPVLYFELLLPIALLSARGIEKLPGILKRFSDEKGAVLKTILFVGSSIIVAFVSFHFYNAKALAKIHDVVSEPYKHINIPTGQKAVVFTDFYLQETGQKSWVAGRKNTHPDLGDDVIYVLDYGKEKDEEFLEKYYPGYQGYLFRFKHGLPKFMPLAEYEEKNYWNNYPDAR